MNEQLQNAIDEVMDFFDFEKVHQVMIFLDWQWGLLEDGPRVPSIGELRRSARRTLRLVIEEGSGFAGSGGFTAYYRADGSLMLWFAVDDWSAEWEGAK